MGEIQSGKRHKVTFQLSKQQPIEIDGLPARIILRPEYICIGCSDIKPEVLEYLVEKYYEKYPKVQEFEIQSGTHPC